MTKDNSGQQRRPSSNPSDRAPVTGSVDGASKMKPVIGNRKKPTKK